MRGREDKKWRREGEEDRSRGGEEKGRKRGEVERT